MDRRIVMLGLVACLLICKACAEAQSKTTKMDTLSSDLVEITDKLVEEHYGYLFNYAIRERVAEKVWEDAGYDKLLRIAKSEQAPMKARFLACEILHIKDFTSLANIPEHTLARIYAQALANNYTGMANSWGLLYKYKGQYEHRNIGLTAGMFLELWDKALPSLIELLDDVTVYLYDGSEEATVGNAYKFRVKDFAAYYIGKITRTPVAYHERHEDRDKEIEKLKKVLKNYKSD